MSNKAREYRKRHTEGQTHRTAKQWSSAEKRYYEQYIQNGGRYRQDDAGFHDDHHILFERHFWDQEPYDLLRNDDGLIASHVSRQLHNYIHQVVSPIPPLGKNLTLSLIKRYFFLKEYFEFDDSPLTGIPRLNESLTYVANVIEMTDLEYRQIKLMKRNLRMQMDLLYDSNSPDYSELIDFDSLSIEDF